MSRLEGILMASFEVETVTECDVAGCRINCIYVCDATDVPSPFFQ